MAVERIISWMPDSVLFLIGFVIAYAIYYYSPDEIKLSIKKVLMDYGVYICLFVFWLYYKNKWGIVADHLFWAEMRYATFLFCMVGGIYFGVLTWLYEFRYYTNHFMCNNLHGSCHRFQEKGDWAIFFLGGSGSSDEKFVLPFPFCKKIVVVPKVAVQFLGNQIFALSQVEKVDLLDLPEEVADFIENDTFGRWCKDNIYAGLWDEKITALNPKYNDLESLYKKSNARVNELKKMLQGKLTTVKQFVSDTFAMQDKITGKRWASRGSQQPNSEA